ncbi:hypothetical protein [Nocardia sp. XZ_19_385]|uniref:hypothetical protein n=1 Tax=Nocardia sp. XZ_19_385 TaxID=2769488 RepID=UPI00188E7FC0|nr:hypothetical protein [Nocardia sp. XZ_19_385]
MRAQHLEIEAFIRERISEDELAALRIASEIKRARELREIVGKRHILVFAQRHGGLLGDSMLRFLAHTWADHADFSDEWTL